MTDEVSVKKRGRVKKYTEEENKHLRSSRTFLYGFRKILKDAGFEETEASEGVYTLSKDGNVIKCYLHKPELEINGVLFRK